MNPQLAETGNSADHIMTLERRIVQLEEKIQQLEQRLSTQQTAISEVEKDLPVTALLSPKFVTRAFAVWGHAAAAQIMIVVPIYCLIFLFSALASR